METKNLIAALTWRYATMKFDPDKKVSEEDLNSILEAGNLMPTSFGLQPFRILIVEGRETKEKLKEHSWGQHVVAENSHLIVLATREDIDEAMVNEYVERIERIRSLPPGSTESFKQALLGSVNKRSPEELRAWAQKQAYIALGGMIAAASERGIDNHGLEGFSPDKYKEVLNLNEKKLQPAVILAIGYRAVDDGVQHQKKVRVALKDMVIRYP